MKFSNVETWLLFAPHYQNFWLRAWCRVPDKCNTFLLIYILLVCMYCIFTRVLYFYCIMGQSDSVWFSHDDEIRSKT